MDTPSSSMPHSHRSLYAAHSDPRRRAAFGLATQPGNKSSSTKMYLLFFGCVVFFFGPWKSILKWSCFMVVAMLGYLYVKQDQLLYVPIVPGLSRANRRNPPGFRSPAEVAIPYEDCWIPTSHSGVTIHGWLMLQPEALRKNAPTLIYFHGNAGNIGTRMPNYKELYDRCKVNIFAVEYRGFGESTGTPSEKGLCDDGTSALAFIKRRTDINQKKLIVFGRSLGGAVAVDLVAKSPKGTFSGLILENTFTSVAEMAARLFPFLKFFKSLLPSLLHNKWETLKKMKTIRSNCPMLFLSGLLDQIVPPEHMQTLYDAVNSKTDKKNEHLDEVYDDKESGIAKDAKIVKFSHSGHNDIMFSATQQYYLAIQNWLQTLEMERETLDGSCNDSETSNANLKHRKKV